MRTRYRRATAAAAATVCASLSVMTSAGPASATVTPTCPTISHILGVSSNTTDKGTLYDYQLTNASSTSTSTYTKVKVSTGWDAYGFVRAGGGGIIWAATPPVTATQPGTATLYNWNWNTGGTTFTRTKLPTPPPSGQSSPWGAYTSAAGKKKITVDAASRIYVLDGSNRILRYAYDFTAKKWTQWALPVAQLSGNFDMIWASDKTVLWARRTDGTAQRIRIDATADRGLVTPIVGSGLGAYQEVFSLGGDTRFAVEATTTGNLKKSWFDEDSFLINGPQVLPTTVGGGWSKLLNVTGVANSCTRTYTAPTAAPAIASDDPIEALGTTTGRIHLAYSDGIGRLQVAMVTGENFSPSWVESQGADGVRGRPAMVLQNDGLVHVYSHTSAGVVKDQKETTAGSGTMDLGTSHRGILTGHPDAVIMSNGTNVLAATDDTGGIWVRQQGTFGDLQYTPWRLLGTGAASGAPITAQPYTAGVVTFYVAAANGGVLTSTVSSSGSMNGPVNLGVPGAGAVGSVSAISYPGSAQRIVVADAAGAVWTKAQDLTTRAWETTWTPVSPGTTITGSPAIALSPVSGRSQIVARDASTGFAVIATETGQNTRQFADFTFLPGADSVALATSPTVFTYTDSTSVRRWGVVGYDSNRTAWSWLSSNTSADLSLQRTAGTSDDVMTLTKLGKLPR